MLELETERSWNRYLNRGLGEVSVPPLSLAHCHACPLKQGPAAAPNCVSLDLTKVSAVLAVLARRHVKADQLSKSLLPRESITKIVTYCKRKMQTACRASPNPAHSPLRALLKIKTSMLRLQSSAPFNQATSPQYKAAAITASSKSIYPQQCLALLSA
jgi:hypothetical protein